MLVGGRACFRPRTYLRKLRIALANQMPLAGGLVDSVAGDHLAQFVGVRPKRKRVDFDWLGVLACHLEVLCREGNTVSIGWSLLTRSWPLTSGVGANSAIGGHQKNAGQFVDSETKQID